MKQTSYDSYIFDPYNSTVLLLKKLVFKRLITIKYETYKNFRMCTAINMTYRQFLNRMRFKSQNMNDQRFYVRLAVCF